MPSDDKAKADALLQTIRDTLEQLEKDDALRAAGASSSGTKMKATELNTATDPMRKVPVLVPEGSVPDGANVWVQRDPLRGMHHITLEHKGMQYTTSVTDAVIEQASDINAVQEAIVQDLVSQMNETEGDTSKYKAITLAYWKWLIEETVSKHISETGVSPRRVFISQEVYEYMVQAEDDLPRASTRRGHKKVDYIIPDGMDWRTRQPEEGDFRRFIRVQ